MQVPVPSHAGANARMDILSAAATGQRKERDSTVRYEVHREREPGAGGMHRKPIVEEFYGLDRARIAALGYALDGPIPIGHRFSGVVRIVQVIYVSGVRCRTELIDVVDERVASRLLNEVKWPHADEMAVPVERLQSSVDALIP